MTQKEEMGAAAPLRTKRISFLRATQPSRRAYVTGTTIVVVRTPSEAVIGADSKFVAKKEDQAYDGTVCKIIQVEQLVFFSAAGLIGATDDTYNVWKTAIDSCQRNRITSDILDDFEKAVQPPLVGALNDVSEKGITPVLDSMTALETVFVSLENDIPQYHVTHFQVRVSDEKGISLIPKRLSCPSSCPDGIGLSALGRRSNITAYLGEHGHAIKLPSVNKAELVNQLIQLEIEHATEGQVDGPIVILRLSRNGPEWLQNGNVCPDFLSAATPRFNKKRPRKRRR
jgi:hypothetical protein